MTMPPTGTVAKGLEGVIAEATRLSDVQGQVGRLLYRGFDIDDLAAHSTFEETVYLLWYGSLPTRPQLDAFNQALAAARPLPARVSVYYTLGILIDLFTPVFAMSRVASWTAHILEQYGDNRLVRPDALYIGETARQYIPIEKR